MQFLPTAPGTRFGAVVLTDQSTPPKTLITVPLSGTGTGPLVAFGPGTITTYAGAGHRSVYNGDTCWPPARSLLILHGVAVDGAGNLYIADILNNRIRKVTPGGINHDLGGQRNAQVTTATTLRPPAAELDHPTGVAVDGAGNLYIADYGNNRIRKVTPAESSPRLRAPERRVQWRRTSRPISARTSLSLWHRGGWRRQPLYRGPVLTTASAR